MLISLLHFLLFFCIVDLFNDMFEQSFDNKYRIVRIKKYLKVQELKKGCVLKSHIFVKKTYSYSWYFKYIYNKALNVCIFNNCIYHNDKVILLKFFINIDELNCVLDFNDFCKKKSLFVCEKVLKNVKLSVTISPHLDISICIKNLTRKKLNIKIKVVCDNIVKKSITNIQGLLREYTQSGCNLLKDFILNKSSLLRFSLKLFDSPLFDSCKFYDIPCEYSQIIYRVLSRHKLTNYSRFKDIKKFCLNQKINLKKVFYLELFSYQGFKILKRILNNMTKLQQFNIELLVIYKNILFKKIEGIKYVDYYSDKLHIFKYFKKYYSFENAFSFDTHKQIQRGIEAELKTDKSVAILNPDNMTYDYIDKCQYGLFSPPSIVLDTQAFYNFKIYNHSLILENETEEIVYNFSSTFKFKDGAIHFKNMMGVIISNKVIKKVDLYDIMLKINSINSRKKLFINFWQECGNENRIYQDIDRCIKLCPPIAMIYHLNDSIYDVFKSTKNVDIVSDLMSYYYLIRGYKLALLQDSLISKYAEKIFQNLYQCYKKAMACPQNDDLLILYLHAKNLSDNQIFKDNFQTIMGIKNTLFKRLKPSLDKIFACTTFDELINKLEPTLFNYEFLLDYLIEFKGKLFKFKSDRCIYDNIFKMENENRHLNVWLKGDKLQTIHTHSMTLNQNLYLPYSLEGFKQSISIHNK